MGAAGVAKAFLSVSLTNRRVRSLHWEHIPPLGVAFRHISIEAESGAAQGIYQKR